MTTAPTENPPAPPAPSPTPTPAPTPAPTAPTPNPEPPKNDDGLEKWKSEARKWEARAKENKDAAERLAKIEEASKTEAQKLADRADAAEKAAADATKQLLRYRIAATKGVDPELLAGDDEESITAHADRLLAWRGTAQPTAPPTPKPDPSQGGRGSKNEPSVSRGASRYAERHKKT